MNEPNSRDRDGDWTPFVIQYTKENGPYEWAVYLVPRGIAAEIWRTEDSFLTFDLINRVLWGLRGEKSYNEIMEYFSSSKKSDTGQGNQNQSEFTGTQIERGGTQLTEEIKKELGDEAGENQSVELNGEAAEAEKKPVAIFVKNERTHSPDFSNDKSGDSPEIKSEKIEILKAEESLSLINLTLVGSPPPGEQLPEPLIKLELNSSPEVKKPALEVHGHVFKLSLPDDDKFPQKAFWRATLARLRLSAEVVAIKRGATAALTSVENSSKNMEGKRSVSAWCRNTFARKKKWILNALYGSFSFFVLFSALWLAQNINLFQILPGSLLGWIGVGCFILSLILYGLIVAFPLTQNELHQINQHSERQKILTDYLGRLASASISVDVGALKGANNKGYTPLPEHFIQYMESVIRSQESAQALARSLRLRRDTVEEVVQNEIRARKSQHTMVLAAGGAVVTGFFAHEVSKTVFDFHDVIDGVDGKSFGAWLKSSSGQLQANSSTSCLSRNLEVSSLPANSKGGICSCNNLTVSDSIACPPPLKPIALLDSQSDHKQFEDFHKSDLDSGGLTLLVTIFAIVVAAALAMIRDNNIEN